MSKELVISATPHETRVAILEDGHLCEIYIEREKEFALVGSIYKGRVTRVLPGMQSAFVDIGRDTDAFLYVSDFLENLEEYDAAPHAEEKSAKPAVEPARLPQPESAQSSPQPPAESGAPDLSSFGEFVSRPAAEGAFAQSAAPAWRRGLQARRGITGTTAAARNTSPGLNPPGTVAAHQGGFSRDRAAISAPTVAAVDSIGIAEDAAAEDVSAEAVVGGRTTSVKAATCRLEICIAVRPALECASIAIQRIAIRRACRRKLRANFAAGRIPGEIQRPRRFRKTRRNAGASPAPAPIVEHGASGLMSPAPTAAGDAGANAATHSLPESLYASPAAGRAVEDTETRSFQDATPAKHAAEDDTKSSMRPPESKK